MMLPSEQQQFRALCAGWDTSREVARLDDLDEDACANAFCSVCCHKIAECIIEGLHNCDMDCPGRGAGVIDISSSCLVQPRHCTIGKGSSWCSWTWPGRPYVRHYGQDFTGHHHPVGVRT